MLGDPQEALGADSWSSEAAFVTEFRSALPRFLSLRFSSWRIYTEVAVGRRTADLVVPVATRIPESVVRPLSELEAVILATLRRAGPTRIDLLEKRSGILRGGLRQDQLSRLEDWNLLRRGPGGRIALSSTWVTELQIVAIEAKLRRWTEALAQAQVYRRYADFSYVALPPDIAIRVHRRHEKELRTASIGLLSLLDTGVEELIPAQRATEHDWQREYLASRISPWADREGHGIAGS